MDPWLPARGQPSSLGLAFRWAPPTVAWAQTCSFPPHCTAWQASRLPLQAQESYSQAARWGCSLGPWPSLLGPLAKDGASLGAQMAKHLLAMWETWVQFLGQEDSPGEGNGNPLQYSCLGNPVDGGAWWATLHGVTKS